MSDDLQMHPSSNSTPADSKLTKLEASVAGKGSSCTTPTAVRQTGQSTARMILGVAEEPLGPSSSTVSDDDIGGQYRIQGHTQKRQKVLVDEEAYTRKSEVIAVETKTSESLDVKSGVGESTRKKHSYRKGRSALNGGAKVADTAHPIANLHTQLESATPKENCLIEQTEDAEKTALLEKVALLRREVASLEEEVRIAQIEAAASLQRSHQLQAELKEAIEHKEEMLQRCPNLRLLV